MAKKEKIKIPVLLAEVIKEYNHYDTSGKKMKVIPQLEVKAWCPFCRGYHIHGANPEDVNSRRLTHRVAHCPTLSFANSFRQTGYYLKVIDKRGKKG